MLFIFNYRGLKLMVTTMVAFSVAMAVPEKGQILQLQDFINGRSDAKFRTTDENRIYELPKGTIGQIDPKEEIVEFKKDPVTKKPSAYGLCIKILNANVSNKKDCYWVYYVESRGNIRILDKKPEEMAKAPQVQPKTVNPDYAPAAATAKAADSSPRQVRISDREVRGLLANTRTEAPAQVKAEEVSSVPAKTVSTSHGADGVVQKIKVDNLHGHPTVVQTTAPTLAVREAARPATVAPAPEPAVAAAKAKATDSGKPGEDAMARNAAVLAGRLSSLNEAINPDPPPELPYCDAICRKLKLLAQDELCTKKNDYLEKDIERLKNTPQSLVQQLFQSKEPAKYIKDQCFRTSLKNVGGIPYMTCKGNDARYVQRPCASEDMKFMVRKSFDLTMDCLGTFYTDGEIPVQSAASSFFFLISQESGHNPNAVSKTGAGGSTQMTDPYNEKGKPDGAITYINKIERKLMLDHLAKSNDPRCEPVKQILEKGMPSGANTCERISIDKGNPLLNLVYGLGYQKYLRANVKKYITENKMARGVFAHMASDLKEYVENQLATWSHNLGPNGMKDAAQLYLTFRKPKPILTRKDADDLFRGIKSYIHTPDRNPSEPIQFLKAIDDKKKAIESTVGAGTCDVTSK